MLQEYLVIYENYDLSQYANNFSLMLLCEKIGSNIKRLTCVLKTKSDSRRSELVSNRNEIGMPTAVRTVLAKTIISWHIEYKMTALSQPDDQ